MAVDIFIIFAVWRWADWRNWRKYHATILFAGAMSLLYNVMTLTHNYFLWKLNPTFFTYTAEEIIHCFVFLPGTALLFLSRWPKKLSQQIKYLFKFIFIYFLVEVVFHYFGVIEYFHGWNALFSLFFYCIMFPGLLLHHKKPGLAYPLFILTLVLGVWFFKIPL
ncbi:MAG TPA: hypothetical protein GXX46_03500 [Peptococcaceae bacterium]|nr:hypothetical protein [Peptococcaceae bacterium]